MKTYYEKSIIEHVKTLKEMIDLMSKNDFTDDDENEMIENVACACGDLLKYQNTGEWNPKGVPYDHQDSETLSLREWLARPAKLK